MGPLSVSRENLAELRARHTAGKSDPTQMRTPPLDEVQSIDNRLDDERRMRTSLKRERRLRLQEQSERLAGIKSALAKTVGMQAEGALADIESELRSEMESELERLERDVLEREEATLREEMKLRLVLSLIHI